MVSLFILVPLIELYLLAIVGAQVGFLPTVALVIVTGVVGASLARREGFRVLAEWQDAMVAGQMPRDGVAGGLLVLVGGILLITPGILTDIIGFLLMVPILRRTLAGVLTSWMAAKVAKGQVQVVRGVSPFGPRASVRRPAPRPTPGGVIEVEGEVLEVDGRPVTPDPA